MSNWFLKMHFALDSYLTKRFNSLHMHKALASSHKCVQHMFCVTCSVSSALYSREGEGRLIIRFTRAEHSRANSAAQHGSPNDTLDAPRQHADASTCAPTMQLGWLGRWKAKQTHFPGCPLPRPPHATRVQRHTRSPQ